MEFFQRLPVPRRLSSRVWLISVPSALLSFERRQRIPRLPVGKGRFAGIPIAIAGAALALWAWRTPGAAVSLPRPLAPLSRKPATFGGILALAGVALLLRSAVLALYSLGVAWAASSGAVAIEEPRVESFLARGGGRSGDV